MRSNLRSSRTGVRTNAVVVLMDPGYLSCHCCHSVGSCQCNRAHIHKTVLFLHHCFTKMILPKLFDNYHFQETECSCVFHVLSLVHALTPRHGSATRPIKGLSQSPRVQVPRRFNNREIFNLSSVKSVKPSDAGRPGGDEHHKSQL